jgi:predicted amidohydrolase
MPTWKIACVQMDCRIGDREHNLAQMRRRLVAAAEGGAKLVVFPECIVCGYGYDSKEEAWPFAEPIPGPSTDQLAEDCCRDGVWAVLGLLERDEATGNLYNAAALIGPDGLAATYRKLHLPCLGVDRFTTPGDRPFAVHDLGGLRLGMNICYDGSFPESARVLTLLGADLIVLPTNFPTGARRTVQYLLQARAFENNVYYAVANRIGEEAGFTFLGQSRIIDVNGDLLAASEGAEETILFAEIDPERARRKRVVNIPGKYEVDRVADRRPEMYELLCRK